MCETVSLTHHRHSYVETAILKCYSFLTNKEYTQALIRLSKMVRGIGDPLVAAYARAYICRVGMSIAPESRTHLMGNFTDYLSTFSQVCVSASSLTHSLTLGAHAQQGLQQLSCVSVCLLSLFRQTKH